jgi:hypothetical protein
MADRGLVRDFRYGQPIVDRLVVGIAEYRTEKGEHPRVIVLTVPDLAQLARELGHPTQMPTTFMGYPIQIVEAY